MYQPLVSRRQPASAPPPRSPSWICDSGTVTSNAHRDDGGNGMSSVVDDSSSGDMNGRIVACARTLTSISVTARFIGRRRRLFRCRRCDDFSFSKTLDPAAVLSASTDARTAATAFAALASTHASSSTSTSTVAPMISRSSAASGWASASASASAPPLVDGSCFNPPGVSPAPLAPMVS
eukprot:21909-Pelagococcus_subviridis.AAC.2